MHLLDITLQVMMNLLSPRRVTSNYFIDRYEIFIHVHKSLVVFEHGNENLTPHSWIRNASTCINLFVNLSLFSLNMLIVHSVLVVILNPQISRVRETSFFRSGWVVGITPYVQFCPIPRPLLSLYHRLGNFASFLR